MGRSRGGGLLGWAALLAALQATACASAPPERVARPDRAEGDADRAAGFEPPPVLRASEILAPELVRGPHHAVDEEVRSDGFNRHYTIASDFGPFAARGDEMLRIRVAEIRALAALDAMSATQEFAAAAARGLRSPFVASWNLIRRPVDSILGVPAGAWQALQRTAALARGQRGELEDSALREFIGFEAKKRELARELGVDPYSSNPALQRRLNRFAWVAFAGSLPFRFVPFQGETRADGEPPDARLRELLLDYSPEDLRRLNRIELAVMGIPGPLAEAFLGQPWFSPRHQTLLVESLAALDSVRNRAAPLEAALAAGSESDALFHQHVAELIRVYHETVAPLDELALLEGTVVARAADGRLVVPAPADHLVWTRASAALLEPLARAIRQDPAVREPRLLLSGSLSPRARRELEALGFRVTERAATRPAPEAREARGSAR